MSKPVTLSQRQREFLNTIRDAKARKATEESLLNAKRAKQEEKNKKNREFWQGVAEKRQQPIEFVVLDTGCIAINYGGGRNVVMVPQKARALVKNFSEFKAMVETLPEVADFSKIPSKNSEE